MTTVALIEDDAAYRTMLEQLAARSGRFRVAAVFDTAEAALRVLPRRPAQLAIVDLGLPGQSGIELVARLRERCPLMRCLVVTGWRQSDAIFAALQAGAAGYVLKSDSAGQLLAALDEVVAGGAPMSRAVARHVVASFVRGSDGHNGTSGRERQIMDALARGYTYKEIGGKLGISTATVKNHLSRIYTKLGVRSRTEAVVKWLRRE